jgi:ABC-2 type transport system permease protein
MAKVAKPGWRLIVRQIEVQFRLQALSWYTFVLLVVQPAIFSGVGFVLARMAGRPAPDLVYTIIGGGVMGLWSSLLFTSFYDISRDRREGTLELIVGSPASLGTVLSIRTLSNVLTGFLSLLASFFVAELWFRYDLPFQRLPGILVSILLLLLSFWCLGMFLANFHAWSRVSGNSVNYIELPVAVLCGFMYPVSVLPGWLQAFSYPLPVRWAVAALNQVLTGQGGFDTIWVNWLAALGLSLTFWLLARWMGRLIHDRIRMNGGLGMV